MWKCIEDWSFLHCTLLPSQPGGFVGLCHSLMCCFIGSHVVWLSLKNYHSNQLSAGNVFLWVKNEQPPTPAVLCRVHRALPPSSLSSGSGILNEGNSFYFWSFLSGKRTARLCLCVPFWEVSRVFFRAIEVFQLQWPCTLFLQSILQS